MSRARTALGSGLTFKGLNVIQPKLSVDLSGQAIVLDPRGEGSGGVDARAQSQYASYMQNTSEG